MQYCFRLEFDKDNEISNTFRILLYILFDNRNTISRAIFVLNNQYLVENKITLHQCKNHSKDIKTEEPLFVYFIN